MTANLTYFLEQDNYGQRLQCYALQRYFESAFGEKLYTLDSARCRRGVRLDDGKHFHRFEKECLNLITPDGRGTDMLADAAHIVIGGDQVLNTDWNISEKELFPYVWERKHPKRNVFFYGAGLSQSHVVRNDVLARLRPHVFAYGLREDCGNITDYFKTIDPVFLIHDQWDGFARGDMTGGEVRYIVKGNPLELSYTTHEGLEESFLPNGTSAPMDPRDFVGLFRGARRLHTNSFHGLCFALMFRIKEVRIQNIEDHRIRNLISMLGIRFDGDKIANYDEIIANIRREVGKAHDFLEMCLSPVHREIFAYSKNKGIRDRSSSGGFCAEAAKLVYSRGGSVYGGAFADDFTKVVSVRTTTEEEFFRRLSKSKYSFCFLPNLRDLKEDVEKGKPVLFIGSPCQIKAIRKYLGREYDNLLLVDFRCRGYSNPRKLRHFAENAVAGTGCGIVRIDFRPNHRIDGVEVTLTDGRVIRRGVDVYRSFVFDSLPMCKRCVFAHGTVSAADATVGDAWDNIGDRLRLGTEFEPSRGCNLVAVHTQKGQRLMDSLKDNLAAVARRPF